jgi:hypothetical protein
LSIVKNYQAPSTPSFVVDTVLVSSLPPATMLTRGHRFFVSDSNVSTFYSIVTGGGSTFVPVWCDGVHWRVG